MFDRLTSAISSSTDDIKKPWANHTAKSVPSEANAVAPPPKKQEKIYFSSRSAHRKVKVKEIAPPKEPSTGSKRSTVASLVNVGRNGRLPSGLDSSTTVYGSVGHESAVTGTTAAYLSERAASISEKTDDMDGERDKYSDGSISPSQSMARLSVSEKPDASVWWDEQKIQVTVTSEFVLRNIHNFPGPNGNMREKLETPVAFGNGLTSTTYTEWIMQRARKFFLVLLELGIPEQIFGIVDNSWDDNDLPMNAEGVEALALARPRDLALEKKFLKVQHQFLLRFINPEGHVDYEANELVPLDVFREPKHSKTPSISSGSTDRVSQPRQRYQVYARKQVTIGNLPGTVHPQDLMDEIDEMRAITHEHIVRLFASYTHRGNGFFLMSPPTEITLKRFLTSPPPSYKKLAEDVRRFKLLDWMHCLADALAYLYDRGVPHQDIRPKSIVLEEKTAKIMFQDIGSFRRMDPRGGSAGGDHTEFYMYGAPELWQRKAQKSVSAAPTNLVFGSGRTARRASKSEQAAQKELAHQQVEQIRGEDAPEALRIGHGTSKNVVTVSDWVSKPAAKSDVFSLGCIFLEMLTFHSKKKSLSQFTSHRQKKHRASGSRGGAVADASFHANLDSVTSWIKELKKEALDRDDDAVQASLILCAQTVKREPEDRPTPREACESLFNIMKTVRRLHCEFHFEPSEDAGSFANWSGWDDPHDYGRNGSETSMGRLSTSSTSGSSVDSFSDRASRHSHHSDSHRCGSGHHHGGGGGRSPYSPRVANMGSSGISPQWSFSSASSHPRHENT